MNFLNKARLFFLGAAVSSSMACAAVPHTKFAKSLEQKGIEGQVEKNHHRLISTEIKDVFGLPLIKKEKGKTYRLVRVTTLCEFADNQGKNYNEYTTQGNLPKKRHDKVIYKIVTVRGLDETEKISKYKSVIIEGAYVLEE